MITIRGRKIQKIILTLLLLLLQDNIGWAKLIECPSRYPHNNILEDILSHHNPRPNDIYDDKMNRVHEGTHYINSELRNTSPGFFFCYKLKNKAFKIPNPPLALMDVARHVPKEKRGRLFNLYLISASKQWNDTPLYLCDECISYINGYKYATSVGRTREAQYSLKCARELLGYIRVLRTLVGMDYKTTDLDEFIQFVEYSVVGYCGGYL